MTNEQLFAFIKRNPLPIGCALLSLGLGAGVYFRGGEIPEVTEEVIQKTAEADRHEANKKNAAQLKEQLEAKRSEVEREADLERAAEIRYGQIPELEAAVDVATERLASLQVDQKMLKEEVDEEDVAEVVAKWTGIPVSRLMEGEIAKLVRLEDVLHERVIGQDEAVHAVANAIRRSRAAGRSASRGRYGAPACQTPSRAGSRSGVRRRQTPTGTPGRVPRRSRWRAIRLERSSSSA